MFGLGFLSAFVLARRVTVRTTSYQSPTLGHCYISSNAEQYTVSPIPARAQVGTEVMLELHSDYLLLAQEGRLREILSRYCALLREPIWIGADSQPINPEPPPWRMHDAVPLHPVQAWRRQREFAARFERNFEPLCCMPVRVEEGSDAVGLLWVQDGATYGTSDNRNLSVFLRGMLLDDNARELLPPWAGFIGGVIESNRLTPTASREDLQRDTVYSAVQHALSGHWCKAWPTSHVSNRRHGDASCCVITKRCWAQRCAMSACSNCCWNTCACRPRKAICRRSNCRHAARCM